MNNSEINQLLSEISKQTEYQRRTFNWVRFMGWFFVVIPMAAVILYLIGVAGFLFANY